MVMTEDRSKGALKSLQASPPWSRHILIIIWTPSSLPGVTTVYLSSLPRISSVTDFLRDLV